MKNEFLTRFIYLDLCIHKMHVEHWAKFTFSLVCIVGYLPSMCKSCLVEVQSV